MKINKPIERCGFIAFMLVWLCMNSSCKIHNVHPRTIDNNDYTFNCDSTGGLVVVFLSKFEKNVVQIKSRGELLFQDTLSTIPGAFSTRTFVTQKTPNVLTVLCDSKEYQVHLDSGFCYLYISKTFGKLKFIQHAGSLGPFM